MNKLLVKKIKKHKITYIAYKLTCEQVAYKDNKETREHFLLYTINKWISYSLCYYFTIVPLLPCLSLSKLFSYQTTMLPCLSHMQLVLSSTCSLVYFNNICSFSNIIFVSFSQNSYLCSDILSIIRIKSGDLLWLVELYLV